MDKIEQAREVSARIWNAGYTDESATIDVLIAELEKVTREAHENKDKARWANAELERVTTIARGQHVELYNARLELERLKSQEPVAWRYRAVSPFKDKNGMCNVSETWSLLSAPGQIDAHSSMCGIKAEPLFLAAGAQPVPSSKYPCKLTDAELADPEYMRSYIEAMNQDYADLLYAQLVQAPEQRKEQP